MIPENIILRVLRQLPVYLLTITSLAVLLSFSWLGQYAHPSADDFCMASGVQQEGLWKHLWNHYVEWSGRYTGNALYAIYPLIFGMFSGLKIMPALLISGLLLACAYFLSRLFNKSMADKSILLVSLCFVSLYLLGMKHTASSLYWPAGALSYQTANILLVFSLGLIIQLMDRQQQQQRYTVLLAVLVMVLILGMGTNETNMLTLTVVIFSTFVFHLRLSWKFIKPWLLQLIVISICFAIVYFSPGNAVRESTFPLRHDFMRAINGSVDMGFWVLSGWLINPVFIVSSLLTPFAVYQLDSGSNRNFNISKLTIVSLTGVILAIPLVLQFPAWWAMGGWPPPRTIDAIYFIFILGWFVLLGAVTIYFGPKIRLFSRRKFSSISVTTVKMLAAILFVVSILGNFKFQRAQTDLWLRADPFHEYMLKRYEIIQNARDSQQLYLQIPAFNEEFPRSIYFNDIMPDARDWRNVCYAAFFGLQQIQRDRQLKKSDHKVKRLKFPTNSYSN